MVPISVTIVILVLLVIALVFSRIDWRKLAIKWVGYNPARGCIYSKAGAHVHNPVVGERFYQCPDGDFYGYQLDDVYEIVHTPADYPHININGRRVIGIEDGQLVASPLGFMTLEQLKKYKESVTDISEMLKGNVMVMAIKSLKSLKVANTMLWIIIVVIIAGFGLYYMNQQKTAQVVTSNVTQASRAMVTSNQTINEPTFGVVVK